MRKTSIFFISSTLLVALVACSYKAPNTVKTVSNNWQPYPTTPPPELNLPAERPKTKVLTQFASSKIKSFTANNGTAAQSADTLTTPSAERYTIVLDTKKAAPIRAQNDLGTMKTDEPDELEKGTIIVSAPTEEAPNGFMQKIDSVTYEQDGDAVIETVPATLAEVIAGSDLTKEQLESTKISVPMNGAALVPPRRGGSKRLPSYNEAGTRTR